MFELSLYINLLGLIRTRLMAQEIQLLTWKDYET